MNFLVVSDIDVHQLNLRPFRSSQFLVENPFKKCVFLHLLNNNRIINSCFWGKNHYLKKKENIL
jgi:hypothetical protein